MVEKVGINIAQLESLVKNSASELTTTCYYTIPRVNLIGLEGEGLKEIAELAHTENRNYYEELVPRTYVLVGKLPGDMKVLHEPSACPPAKLLEDPTDIKATLTSLVDSEGYAIRKYAHICNITAGKDNETYDLSQSILNEEIEHNQNFRISRRGTFRSLHGKV